MGSMISYVDFIDWLTPQLSSVAVKLHIPASARNPSLINTEVFGVEEVLKLYSWKTSWIDEKGTQFVSQDWESTKISIKQLSNNIRSACTSEKATERDVLEACKHILSWGGERDNRKGASKFLDLLMNEGMLKSYLLECKEALQLKSLAGPSIEKVKKMNSMLTKIHAFMADDGLPIYDSRVAVAAACFVEFYRRETNPNADIPGELLFPAVGGQGERRTVTRLFPDFRDLKILRYGQKNMTYEWTRAKWNLGKVIHDVLESDPNLFANEGDISSRAHALEASFFMIGYDVKCLLN